jgi:hypothetical protein
VSEPKSLNHAVNSNLFGGALILMVALVAWSQTRALEFGSTAEIGPGLFPIVLAYTLGFLGLVMMARGLLARTTKFDFPNATSIRSINFTLGAILLFAFTIRGFWFFPALGLLGATPLAVLVSGLANPETRWRQSMLLALGLAVFCAGLFRVVLSLPIPLAPWILGY